MAISKMMQPPKTPRTTNTMPKARLVVLGGDVVVVVIVVTVVVLPAKHFSIFLVY